MRRKAILIAHSPMAFSKVYRTSFSKRSAVSDYGTSNYDEAPTIPRKIWVRRLFQKPMIQKVTNARSRRTTSNIDKLNDHELVDLKNAIERELKRRADVQSHHVLCRLPASLMLRILLIWTTPYVA